MGNYLSTPNATKVSEHGFAGDLRYAVTSMQGWRVSMEDAHVAHTFEGDESGGLSGALFGVYDGHGGAHVAKFVSRRIVDEILKVPDFQKGRFDSGFRSLYVTLDQLLWTEEVQQELESYVKSAERFRSVDTFDDESSQEPSSDCDEELGRFGSMGKLRLPLAASAAAAAAMSSANEGEAAESGIGSSNSNATPTVTANPPEKSNNNNKQEEKSGAKSRPPPLSHKKISFDTCLSTRQTPKSPSQPRSPSNSTTKSPTLSNYSSSDSPYLTPASSAVPTSLILKDGDEALMGDDGGRQKLLEMIPVTLPSPRMKLGDPSLRSVSSAGEGQGSKRTTVAADAKTSGNDFSFEEVADPISEEFTFQKTSSNDMTETDLNNHIASAESTYFNSRSSKPTRNSISDAGSMGSPKVPMPRDLDAAAKSSHKNGGSSAHSSGGHFGVLTSHHRKSAKRNRQLHGNSGTNNNSSSRGGGSAEFNDDADGSRSGSSTSSSILPQSAAAWSATGGGTSSNSGKKASASIFSFQSLKSIVSNIVNAGKQLGMLGRHPPAPQGLATLAGCTAVSVLIHDGKIIVANAGDSRCVLCRDSHAVELSQDHKPSLPEERARIYAAGGWLEMGRVNGNLNLSRALGDLMYKVNHSLPPERQILSAVPDVTVTPLSASDEFLIVGCDGIWESFTSQEIVDFVREKMVEGVELTEILESLFQELLSPNPTIFEYGCDNMTAIIVDLRKDSSVPKQNQKSALRVLDAPRKSASSSQLSLLNEPTEGRSENHDRTNSTNTFSGTQSSASCLAASPRNLNEQATFSQGTLSQADLSQRRRSGDRQSTLVARPSSHKNLRSLLRPSASHTSLTSSSTSSRKGSDSSATSINPSVLTTHQATDKTSQVDQYGNESFWATLESGGQRNRSSGGSNKDFLSERTASSSSTAPQDSWESLVARAAYGARTQTSPARFGDNSKNSTGSDKNISSKSVPLLAATAEIDYTDKGKGVIKGKTTGSVASDAKSIGAAARLNKPKRHTIGTESPRHCLSPRSKHSSKIDADHKKSRSPVISNNGNGVVPNNSQLAGGRSVNKDGGRHVASFLGRVVPKASRSIAKAGVRVPRKIDPQDKQAATDSRSQVNNSIINTTNNMEGSPRVAPDTPGLNDAVITAVLLNKPTAIPPTNRFSENSNDDSTNNTSTSNNNNNNSNNTCSSRSNHSSSSHEKDERTTPTAVSGQEGSISASGGVTATMARSAVDQLPPLMMTDKLISDIGTRKKTDHPKMITDEKSSTQDGEMMVPPNSNNSAAVTSTGVSRNSAKGETPGRLKSTKPDGDDRLNASTNSGKVSDGFNINNKAAKLESCKVESPQAKPHLLKRSAEENTLESACDVNDSALTLEIQEASVGAGKGHSTAPGVAEDENNVNGVAVPKSFGVREAGACGADAKVDAGKHQSLDMDEGRPNKHPLPSSSVPSVSGSTSEISTSSGLSSNATAVAAPVVIVQKKGAKSKTLSFPKRQGQ